MGNLAKTLITNAPATSGVILRLSSTAEASRFTMTADSYKRYACLRLEPDAEATSDNTEIVQLVSRSGANITVIRAQQDSTALNLVAGSVIYQPLTEAELAKIKAEIEVAKSNDGTVTTDETLTGDGSTDDPLAIAEPFSNDEKAKLAGIEDGAEANIGEEYTQDEKDKLAGIEDGATAGGGGTDTAFSDPVVLTGLLARTVADRLKVVTTGTTVPAGTQYIVINGHRTSVGASTTLESDPAGDEFIPISKWQALENNKVDVGDTRTISNSIQLVGLSNTGSFGAAVYLHRTNDDEIAYSQSSGNTIYLDSLSMRFISFGNISGAGTAGTSIAVVYIRVADGTTVPDFAGGTPNADNTGFTSVADPYSLETPVGTDPVYLRVIAIDADGTLHAGTPIRVTGDDGTDGTGTNLYAGTIVHYTPNRNQVDTPIGGVANAARDDLAILPSSALWLRLTQGITANNNTRYRWLSHFYINQDDGTITYTVPFLAFDGGVPDDRLTVQARNESNTDFYQQQGTGNVATDVLRFNLDDFFGKAIPGGGAGRVLISLRNPTSGGNPITLNTEAEIDADDFVESNAKIFGVSTDPTDSAIYPSQLFYFKDHHSHRVKVRMDSNVTSRSLSSPWHAIGWSTINSAVAGQYVIGGYVSPDEPEGITGIVQAYNQSTGMYKYIVAVDADSPFDTATSLSMRVYQSDGTAISPHITITRTNATDTTFESADLSSDPLNLVTASIYSYEFRPLPTSPESDAFDLFTGVHRRQTIVDDEYLQEQIGEQSGNLQIFERKVTILPYEQMATTEALKEFTFLEAVSTDYQYDITVRSGNDDGLTLVAQRVEGDQLIGIPTYTPTTANPAPPNTTNTFRLYCSNNDQGSGASYSHDKLHIIPNNEAPTTNFFMRTGRQRNFWIRVRKIVKEIR